MTTLLVMAALAAICWVFRIAFIVLVPAQRLPAGVRRALGHLAPAVLAALVAVELLETSKDSSRLAVWLVLGSVALVALVVRLTRNMTVAVAVALGAALAIDLVALA